MSYVFISVAGGLLYRMEIENELRSVLMREKLGSVVGGGTWLDKDEFDIEIETSNSSRSIAVVKEVVKKYDGRVTRFSARD